MSSIQQPKVVVIGSGSLFFGRQAIWQMAHSPHLNQGALALVDKDPARMEKMGLLAEKVVAETGVRLRIEVGTDWKDALPGALSNMAEDAFLELLCDVDMRGPRPRPVGEMPRGLRGLNELVLDTHELTAEAIVKADYGLLRRALMTDPLTNSIADADAIMRELLAAEREALPNHWYAEAVF